MKKSLIKAASITLAFGLLMSGCAAQQTQPAEEPAAMPASEDTSAQDTANRALAVANEALDAARQAQSSAETALACCNENADKLDRLLEKAMQK